MNITGIVIAGGKSLRMGTDKALLLYHGKTMLEHAIGIIEPICNEVIISRNGHEFGHLGYRIVPDERPDCGPVMGLYSALKQAVNPVSVVISCDVPNVPSALYRYLLQYNSGDAVQPKSQNSFVEPLIAVYNKSALAGIEQALAASDFKLQNLRKYLNVCEVLIEPSLPFYQDKLFLNVNAPEDYKRIS